MKKSVALETVPCGICGSKRFTHLFDARDYIYGNEGSWPAARCSDCGVVFMNPRIPPAEIGPFYPKAYYTNEAEVPKSRVWKDKILNAMLRRYRGYEPLTSPGWLASCIALSLGPLLSRMESFGHYVRWVPGGKVLDVGCGNGRTLSKHRQLGWKTYGTEVGLDSARLAREAGHEIYVGELHDAKLPSDSFDAVTLWDALEHIHNPMETAREIFRICRPGGSVYIYVPNFGSVYGQRFQGYWYMFTAPIHYYHYTSETLSDLLKRAGFINVEIEYPLGAAGFQPTLAASAENSWWKPLVAAGPGKALLKLADKVMPFGHLLAIANKPIRSSVGHGTKI